MTEIKEGGRDYEVTVQFDTAGVRKMFALFAKLIKYRLEDNIVKIGSHVGMSGKEMLLGSAKEAVS